MRLAICRQKLGFQITGSGIALLTSKLGLIAAVSAMGGRRDARP
jgi:hypothetical protein